MKKYLIGFTLIELLIAITIFAIISVMAYSGLNSVLKSHEMLNKQQQSFKEIAQIITQLQKEIRHIVPRPVHDKYNLVLPAIKVELGTDLVIFSFTRAGIPNPSGIQKNSLQRIDYIFNKQTLRKRIWLTVDINNIEDFREEIVLSPLKQFKVELLGYDNNWYPQWPVDIKTDPVDLLPKAVRFSLVTDELGQISRIVELPL
jgi:general secretion pathway protein J